MDGVKTIIHRHNDGNGTLTFESVQDCTAIAEAAMKQQNSGLTGSADVKLAARLPLVMVEAYLNNNKITMHEFLNNQDHIKRMCNDPALAHFRVWKGNL
jgi:hypothetical protein